MNFLPVIVDELLKLGAISDEHAQKALDRLADLKKATPTPGQLGRYGAVGAIAAPAIGAVGNVIRGRSPFEGKGGLMKLRDAASMATRGGLAASVIPIARAQSDRMSEISTLKKYVAEREPKLASLQEARGPNPDVREARIGGLGAVGAMGANSALGALHERGVQANVAGKSALYDKIKRKATVPIHEVEESGVAQFNPKPPRVIISKAARNPASLAHELGHAGIQKHPIGKLVQNGLTGALAYGAPVLGPLTGAAAGLSDDPTYRRLGVIAPAVASAPELLYEGAASISALGRLRRAGATPAQIRQAVKSLAPGWGTYAAWAGMGTLGAYGARGAVTNLRKSREQAKATEGVEVNDARVDPFESRAHSG